MRDTAEHQDRATTRGAGTEPAKARPLIVRLERVSWRVMHQPHDGGRPVELGTDVSKTMAARLAATAAQKLADDFGRTVELHTQDAQGRPSGTRYFDPTPEDKPEKEAKK
ncbi:hypothetical protein LCGC14_0567940 [marine sediment metagenome]|uniref:Uncharacterized protein n=1 Tax=marine sediment metagenome TaxID=412755 RepID=A0A0F9RQB0_9ZZZZ